MPVRAPMRTCVACGRKDKQSSFWRVARDPSGRVSSWSGFGRSAYICPNPSCLTVALAKGRLDRALRCRTTEEERRSLNEELICKLR